MTRLANAGNLGAEEAVASLEHLRHRVFSGPQEQIALTAPSKTDTSGDLGRLSSVLADVQELTATCREPHVYFERLMEMIAPLLHSESAACWMHHQQQTVARLAEIQFDQLELQNDLRAQRSNQNLLAEVIRHSRPLVQPLTVAGKPGVTHVVALPVCQSSVCIGVLEFFAGGTVRDPTPEGTSDLVEISHLITEFLDRYEDRVQATDPERFLETFKTFTRACHGSLDPLTVATNAVNDAAAIFDCDRATLLIPRRTAWRVFAVNGKARFNHRSNQVGLLQALTGRVLLTREPFAWSGGNVDIPAELTQPLATYVEESRSRMIHIQPLYRTQRQVDPVRSDDSHDGADREIIGAMVLEQFDSNLPHPLITSYLATVCDQLSIALSNALAYHRVPFLRLFDAAGRATEWLRSRTAAIVAAVVLVVAALVTVLAFLPANYRVEATGKLMPVVQRRVFAPTTAEIQKVLVDPGMTVTAGTPLIVLKNDELQSELSVLESQRVGKQQELHSRKSEFIGASGTRAPGQLIRLQAEAESARMDLQTLEQQIEHVSQQIESLVLRSPVDGTVVTFLDEQQLMGRPVNRGESLLEVMDETGDWQLELQVSEDRMQHIQHGRIHSDDVMQASFRLESNPSREYSGQLNHVAERTTFSRLQGAVVQVRVGLDKTPDLERRIGADVRARLDCGEYSLMYVLFGDAVEFVQRHIWF